MKMKDGEFFGSTLESHQSQGPEAANSTNSELTANRVNRCCVVLKGAAAIHVMAH